MSTKKLFIFVTLSLVIAWFLYPQILPFIFIYLPEPELKEFSELYGTVGDSFGALNTLFSGLALIGVVFSLHAQSKESKENYKRQQEQNSYNQEVLEKTRIQVQLQEEMAGFKILKIPSSIYWNYLKTPPTLFMLKKMEMIF